MHYMEPTKGQRAVLEKLFPDSEYKIICEGGCDNDEGTSFVGKWMAKVGRIYYVFDCDKVINTIRERR